MNRSIKVNLKQNSKAEIILNDQHITGLVRRIEIIGEVRKACTVTIELIAMDVEFEGDIELQEYIINYGSLR